MNVKIRQKSKNIAILNNNKHFDKIHFPVKTVFTFLIYLAIVLSLTSMFKIEIEGELWFTFIPGLVLIILLHIIRSKKVRIALVSCLMIVLVMLLIERNGYLIQGMLSLWNQVAEIIGLHTGKVFPQYKVTLEHKSLSLAEHLFLGCFACIVALFSFFTVEYTRNVLLWLIIIPIFIVQLIIGITPAHSLNLILLVSAILLMNYTFIHRTNKQVHHNNQNGVVFASTSILLIIMFAICLAITKIFVPEATYSKPAMAKQLKNMVEQQIYDFRYEKKQTNTFTQGDFTRLKELKLSDEEALEVVMDKPISLYLRGFVGEKYTQTRWKALDEDVMYESYGLFYWLQEEGFSPLRQLSLVAELADGREDDIVKVTIHNKNANSKYVYTPYELSSPVEGIDEESGMRGVALISDDFFGSRVYSYEIKENLVKEYPGIANRVYEMKESGEKERYFDYERHYNDFVYDNYTVIPEHIVNLLKHQLQVTLEGDGQHISYEEAIDFVRTYLNENLQYTVDVSPVPDNYDFLTYLFEETRSGYAAHFATAGTMIFRYLGIPARYVEGYLITPDDVEGVEEYERITIPGANAHAWTEIYLDQVGWIPIEVTPPYYDVMEPTDFSDYPSGEAASNSTSSANDAVGGSLDTNQTVTDEERFYDMDNQEPPDGMGALTWILIILTLIILGLIGAYFVYAIIKRKQLKDLKTSFHKQPYKDAVSNIFIYSVSLLRYDGLSVAGGSLYQYAHVLEKKYSETYATAFKKAASINQEARYSGKDIPEEKFIEMHRFMEDTLKQVLAGKSIWKRLKMRFIDFIY